MHSLLVTGSDTGIGKTRVVSALVRILARGDLRVQVVKVVETGVETGAEGDADRACRQAGGGAVPYTLASFPLPLAPATAAAVSGRPLSFPQLSKALRALPDCDWRIFEGAGGIASPIDQDGRDWADFAVEFGADLAVLVVANRLGAINQARLAWARAVQVELKAGVWLTAVAPVDSAVAESNRSLLRAVGVPVWAEQVHGAEKPERPAEVLATIENACANPGPGGGGRQLVIDRLRAALADRDRKKLRRVLRVTEDSDRGLNLADNDYLDLSRDPEVAAAAAACIVRDGTSASASPLITGWRLPHARLVEQLCAWHRFPFGLLWSSGFAANSALLGCLPGAGELILADRLVHHSMISGMRRSEARWQRYRHLDLGHLEDCLARAPSGSPVWVATESLFSMEGDRPDLTRLAELKRRYGFLLILDEAHALGWYGQEGAGLARAAGIESEVDIFVATLGKTLASGGAYTLFRDESLRDYLMNAAGEFIYSTALPPAAAAAAGAALKRVRLLAGHQAAWHEISATFRANLTEAGWSVPSGDSPIVPIRLENEAAALSLAETLRGEGIEAAAVRPPTVPAGTSRLRFSLKRTFTSEDADRVISAMARWRGRR